MEITRYNESNTDCRNIYLTASNLVDTISIYNGIAFTHPTGTIRLDNDTHFTHFITTFAGQKYIYKIIRGKAINGNHIEYDYEVDWLKQYFTYIIDERHSALGGATVLKTNVGQLWDYYKPSPEFFFSELYSTYTQKLGSLTGTIAPGEKTFLLIVKNTVNMISQFPCGESLYILNQTQLSELYTYLNTSPNGTGFYKQIKGVYLLPGVKMDIANIPNLTGIIGEFKNLVYQTLDPQQQPQPIIVMSNIYTITGFEGQAQDSSKCYKTWDLESIPLYVDFITINRETYTLRAPFIGQIHLNMSDLLSPNNTQRILDNITISITYYYNLFDGTFTYQIRKKLPNGTYYPSEMIPYLTQSLPLPQISLPSGDQALAFYSEDLNYNKRVSTALASGVTNVVSQSLMQNPIGAVTSIAATAANLIDNNISSAIQKDLISKQGTIITDSQGLDFYTDYDFYLIASVTSHELQQYDILYYCGLNYSQFRTLVPEYVVSPHIVLKLYGSYIESEYKYDIVNDIEKDYISLNTLYTP